MQALHLRQLASNWLGSLSVRASWICGLFCVSAVLIPVWVDVLIPVWGRLNVCTDPCLCASGCTRPRTSPLSSGSPITLDLWERIHPQGLWNQRGSLQLSYLISLCRSTISTSYFRLLVVGSRADLQQPRPPCCLPARWWKQRQKRPIISDRCIRVPGKAMWGGYVCVFSLKSSSFSAELGVIKLFYWFKWGILIFYIDCDGSFTAYFFTLVKSDIFPPKNWCLLFWKLILRFVYFCIHCSVL